MAPGGYNGLSAASRDEFFLLLEATLIYVVAAAEHSQDAESSVTFWPEVL